MLGKAPKVVRAVFIHDVVATPEAQRAAYRERGVYFVDSYVDAAVEAFRLGLISGPGLERVVARARLDFASIEFDSAEQRSTRLAELEAACTRAASVRQ
jgi:hypothetical protein